MLQKESIINPDTLGDVKKYSCLVGLSDLINSQQQKEKEKIMLFLNKFNEICNKSERIEDLEFRHYVLNLIKETYTQKLKVFPTKFGKDIASHTSNYVATRLKIMMQEIKPVKLPPPPKKTTCGIFLIDATGKFLAAHPTNGGPDFWSIPKGLKDAHEDTLGAAKREFLEETGIDIDKFDCELVFEVKEVRYNDNKKALACYFYKTKQVIDPSKCFCDSMVYPKDGRKPFPENDLFAMFDKNDLHKIHYTQKTAFEIFNYSENI